jgi:PAS domain S-box-containing protein
VRIWGSQFDITERVKAPNALRESEEYIRNLVEQANDGIALVQDGKPHFVNSYLAGLLGYSPAEVLNTPFENYIAADEQPKVLDIHRRRLNGEAVPSVYETVIQRKDGSQVEVEFNAGLTKHNGRPAILVVVRDITARKQAEEALKESEERFRGLMEQSPVSIQIHSPEGSLTQSNAAYARLYALNQETLGELYDKYNVLQDEQAKRLGVMPFIKKAFAGEEVVFPPYEYDGIDTLKALDFDNPISRKCWVQTHGFPLKDKDGGVTSVVFLSEDITEQKRAEDALKQREAILEALAFAAERFLTEVNWEEEMDVILDHLGKATGVSRVYVFQNQAGLQGEILTSQRFEWCAPGILPEIDNPDLQNFPLRAGGFGRWEEMLSRGNVIHGHMRAFPESEHEVLAAQGIRSLVVVPVFAEGRWWGFIGFDECKREREWSLPERDALRATANTFGAAIDRQHAEREILEYQQRLKALASELTLTEEKERRRIAADLHDHVGQALALARIQLASARKATSDAGVAAILDDTSASLRQAIQDTRDLVFDLSSPVLNEIGLAAAISEWLEEQVEKKHGLQTEFICDDQEPELDEDMRAILFRNVRELLNNVVRHAGANKVSVRMERVGDTAIVVIQDDGVGFDTRAASEATDRKGGFGLFSIRERMLDLGGALEIVSEPGQGCMAIMTASLKSREDEG